MEILVSNETSAIIGKEVALRILTRSTDEEIERIIPKFKSNKRVEFRHALSMLNFAEVLYAFIES